MTTDELKAAAERLLACDGELEWKEQYEGSENHDFNDDVDDVAKCFLARLAADEQQEKEDAEPITEELLRSLGFSAAGRGILYMHVGHTGMSWSQLGMFYGTTAIGIKTRGQLRKLLEALKGSA